MFYRDWVSWLLFVLGCTAAVLLAVLVLVAPWLDAGEETRRWARLVALFARDAAVRRTSLASAAGLLVTACVFFLPWRPRSAVSRRGRPRSGGVGA
jgi:hypothetical protein